MDSPADGPDCPGHLWRDRERVVFIAVEAGIHDHDIVTRFNLSKKGRLQGAAGRDMVTLAMLDEGRTLPRTKE